MTNRLVLSTFSGIDLLGLAFKREGFCVVSAGDVIWGTEWDIHTFHPPAGVFAGVIGGPPCQAFSPLRHLIRHNGHEPRFGNLIPEFERVVAEAAPLWFLMENVPAAPVPLVQGYLTSTAIVRDCWVGGVQPRPRRFSFGTHAGLPLDIEWVPLMLPAAEMTLLAGHGLLPGAATIRHSLTADPRPVPVSMLAGYRLKSSIGSEARQLPTDSRIRSKVHGSGGHPPRTGSLLSVADACEIMGLPRDFTDHMPFTMQGKRSALGNGVPMPMGRSIARAVARAVYHCHQGDPL